jgi:hypothetical protein
MSEDQERLDQFDSAVLKKRHPMAYDAGWNRGCKYYEDCVPRKLFRFNSKYTGFYEKLAFTAGVNDGYDESEKTDYRINDFPIDDE